MKAKECSTLILLSIIFFLVLMSIPLPVFALENEAREMGLTLSDAITTAMENNLDIQIEQKNKNINKESVIVAESAFDAALTADSYYDHMEEPTGITATVYGNVGIKKTFTTGTSYSLGLQHQREDTEGNQDLEYSSTAALIVTQPLLKNRGEDVNTANILISNKNVDLSVSQLTAEITDIVSSVKNKYWELLQARGILEADEYSLKLANDLVKVNESKVREGAIASIEVLQAKATAALREVSILTDEQLVRDIEDELKELMNIQSEDLLWSAYIIPETIPSNEKLDIVLSEQIEFALENREELKQLRLSTEIKDISMNRLENQLLPSLDLMGSISVTGTDETFGDSLGNVTSPDTHEYSIGLYLQYPLGNRAAKSEYNIAKIENSRLKLSIKNMEQQITTQVRQAVRGVYTAHKQIEATIVAQDLAQQQLNAEQKKFNKGLSTNFQVLDYQDKLATALSSSTIAIVTYQKAINALDKIVGATIINNNINLQ